MVGQALGARKPERAEESVWTAAKYNAVVLGAISVFFVAFAPWIVSIFTIDPAVAPYASSCLRIVSTGFVFFAYGLVFTQAFNGAGDTWTPTWINLGCFWLWQIPLAWLLAIHFGMGPQGVFIAMTVAFSLRSAVSGLVFRRGRWKNTAYSWECGVRSGERGATTLHLHSALRTVMIHTIGGAFGRQRSCPGKPPKPASRSSSTRCAPVRPTAVHQTGCIPRVSSSCSNSFRADWVDNAVGLIAERKTDAAARIDVMRAADGPARIAGAALAVDRHVFPDTVTKAVQLHPRIRISREEVTSVPGNEWSPVIIATGPLTSDALSQSIQQMVGEEHLAFYDAISPIVLAESIDMSKVFRASRWGRNVWSPEPGAALEQSDEGDYLNCPMTKEEYDAFYAALVSSESATVHDFDNTKFFEGCLPIEVMAHRGEGTLRFGPMKPVGLKDPRTGRLPYAVVQLRQDTLAADHFSLVGFQTQIKWGDQARVLRLVPGLEQAEFVRFGMVHRNTYICGPEGVVADVADETPRGLVFRRAGIGRRGYVEGGVGPDRGPHAAAIEGRGTAGAAHHRSEDRVAGALRVARRSEELPADQHHARHHAAARPSTARQDEEEDDDRRARAGRSRSLVPAGAGPVMRVLMRVIAALAAGLCVAPATADAERTRVLVRYDGIVIDTIVEGQGPSVVLLPSLARDSDDYDAVADGLARKGLRVLRPQPRGIGRSAGPSHITPRLCERCCRAIRQLGDGRAVVRATLRH